MSTEHQSIHDHPPVDALRLWLTSGIHKFAVDPRRRLGRLTRARQLLTQDCPPSPAGAEAWQLLASTLDRHTVLGGMTELSSLERRVLTLAYLEGCTNREIALGLGISVTMVRRLLRRALEGVDAYLARTGTWIYAILLVGAGLVLDAATRLGRSLRLDVSSQWTQVLESTAAVGAVAAAALAVAVVNTDANSPLKSSAPARVHTTAATAGVGAPALFGLAPGLSGPLDGAPDQARGRPSSAEPTPKLKTKVNHPAHGCGGMTAKSARGASAARRQDHPKGPPATNPHAGGCTAVPASSH